MADAGIIMSGSWGTWNKFTCLTDMGKHIGVLNGNGGFEDELEEMRKKVKNLIKGILSLKVFQESSYLKF